MPNAAKRLHVGPAKWPWQRVDCNFARQLVALHISRPKPVGTIQHVIIVARYFAARLRKMDWHARFAHVSAMTLRDKVTLPISIALWGDAGSIQQPVNIVENFSSSSPQF